MTCDSEINLFVNKLYISVTVRKNNNYNLKEKRREENGSC